MIQEVSIENGNHNLKQLTVIEHSLSNSCILTFTKYLRASFSGRR